MANETAWTTPDARHKAKLEERAKIYENYLKTVDEITSLVKQRGFEFTLDDIYLRHIDSGWVYRTYNGEEQKNQQ